MNQVIDRGPAYRYRYVTESNDTLLDEFLR